MASLIYGALAWIASSFFARLLIGAGLTLVVFSGFDIVVSGILDQVVLQMSALPAAIVQLALLSGFATCFNLVASAFMTKIAIKMASNIAGLKK